MLVTIDYYFSALSPMAMAVGLIIKHISTVLKYVS